MLTALKLHGDGSAMKLKTKEILASLLQSSRLFQREDALQRQCGVCIKGLLLVARQWILTKFILRVPPLEQPPPPPLVVQHGGLTVWNTGPQPPFVWHAIMHASPHRHRFRLQERHKPQTGQETGTAQ